MKVVPMYKKIIELDMMKQYLTISLGLLQDHTNPAIIGGSVEEVESMDFTFM